MRTSWNFKDLTGQRFGKLLVIQRTDNKSGSGGAIWECRCDCGSTIVVRSTNLLQGRKTDCGCVKAARRARCEAMRKARIEENARLRAERKAQKEAETQAKIEQKEAKAQAKIEQKERQKAEKELARKAKKILAANERVEKDEVQLWEEKIEEYKKWGLTGTLCWNCIRSAAPPSLQCIWDKSKGQQLPEGAEYKGYLNSNGAGYGVTVTRCPEFLPLYERENAELLERERAKIKQKIAQDYYEKVNAGVKHARG